MTSIWNIHNHPTVVKTILFLFPVFYLSILSFFLYLNKDKQLNVNVKPLIYTPPRLLIHPKNSSYVWEVITFIERGFPRRKNITKRNR